MSKGLLMVYTGAGKGKTTAALGQVFRALGYGFRICVIQFIKGSWKYGELEAAKRFDDLLEVHVLGKGFTWKSENLEEDIAIARDAWSFAKQKIESADYDMIVLDEITYLMKYGMVDTDEIVTFLRTRPDALHVICTGRDAPDALMTEADLVTEMVAIKHHFDAGIKAIKGIEF